MLRASRSYGENAMLGVVIRAFAISIGLFLCGCADLVARMDAPRQPQQTNFDEKDENICRSQGAVPEFPGYLECRKQLAAQRASAAAAAAEANRQQGDGMIDVGAGMATGR
jgi:hypothetical protein